MNDWATKIGITRWLEEDLSAAIYRHTVNGGTFQFNKEQEEVDA
jgi:hypothetical protein